MPGLLIIRFSALGDVAMTLPVIGSLAESYPDLEITILSQKSYAPLFSYLPENVTFYGADIKGEHRGMLGLHRLYNEILRPMKFEYVADFHWVLRSIPFYVRFKLKGTPAAHIYKDHWGKRLLTRRRNKIMKQQATSFERYRQVLVKLGFDFSLNFTSIFGAGKGDLSRIPDFIPPKGEEKWLGIAPFAKHIGKIYPLAQMQKVVEHFAACNGVKVFLFGAGLKEREVLEAWRDKMPDSVYVAAGRLRMDTELILMSHLDAMITMDSANMHFASLVNIPVVSVWGATHPYCGFLGYGQSQENCVQIELECRPCSVFGNKPCFRKDYACMNQLPFERIIRTAEVLIHKKGGGNTL